MLVDAELDAGTELDATARRSDLSCVERESGREARGAAECSTRREAQATRGKSSARREARGTSGACEARGADGSIPSCWTDAW
jgi:hypothetical protein